MGPRNRSRRIVLELLSRRRNESFVAYSGEELEEEAKRHGATGTASGWIRDLREEIVALLQSHAGIISEGKDVILSGGLGYRFSESLTVQYVDSPVITDITDTAEPADVRNVRDHNVRNDGDVRDQDVRDDKSAKRRKWILEQLQNKVKLKAPMVVAHFKCSRKTAERDFGALREEGKIEFVGTPRTGYYRIRKTRGAVQ